MPAGHAPGRGRHEDGFGRDFVLLSLSLPRHLVWQSVRCPLASGKGRGSEVPIRTMAAARMKYAISLVRDV